MSLHKTRGIVLHQLKYSETSVIVKIYTELFGLQTYIIKGVRKKNHSVSPALLQHLSLLDLVVYHSDRSSIHHIKEIAPASPFATIPFDLRKTAIAIFVNEIIYKSLQEEEANTRLFNFLFTAIQFLDSSEEKVTNFHLWFCVRFSKYLGFFPSGRKDEKHAYFDILEGVFCEKPPDNPLYLDPRLSSLLHEMMSTDLIHLKDLTISYLDRKRFLPRLIEYYKAHLQGFGEIKSMEVLDQVLS